MVDVYDGRFPSSRPDIFSRSKDNANPEQEERRLFYVGITRAKNDLYLFGIKNRISGYIDELFPEAAEARHHREAEAQRKRLEAEAVRRRKTEEAQRRMREEQMRIYQEQRARIEEEQRKAREEAIRQEIERKQREAQEEYKRRYDSVKDLFTQQEKPIFDYTRQRWVQCEICNCIKEDNEFVEYGGPGHVNLGKCYGCSGRRNR